MRGWLLRRFGVALTATLTAGMGVAVGATAPAAAAPATQAGPEQIAVAAPPMGWASWNAFGAKIDAKTIKEQADALVSSGLAAAGYNHVNIDEGWWQGTRDSEGNIVIDEAEWPGGMSAIADYIHSKGLKAGIYTDAGKDGCGYYFPTGRVAAPGSGSEGHYDQDFLQFSKWGFDFVKVDWCGGAAEKLDAEATYRAISASVAKASATTGRELVLSMCNWGRENTWNWAPGLGRMWRTSDDIIAFQPTATPTDTPVLYPATLGQVLTNFDKAQHPTSHHTGYLNDPDMLTVGLPGLTDDQARTEMSLWAITGAPLLAGNILTTMTDATAEILKNREVIAVDQDPRGLPGVKLTEERPGLQVYAKTLAGSGKRAVVLLNRNSAAASMTVRWKDLGLAAAPATVRDLWAAADRGSFPESYTVTVPGNGSVTLTVAGTEATAATYEAEAAANTLAGTAAKAACPDCSGGSRVGGLGEGNGNTLRFNAVSGRATGPAVLDIAYVNSGTTTRTGTLAVNGQVPTVVAFPPTGAGNRPGQVSVVASLRRDAVNTLTFGGTTGPVPDLDAVTVSPIPGAAGTQIVNAESNRCLDIFNNTIETGTDAEIWDCFGGLNQSWTYGTDKTLMVFGTRCIDAWGEGRTDGTRVALWYCSGNANQRWNINANGTIVGEQSGLCLEARNGTGNGTKLVLGTCKSEAANQRWTVDPAAPADVTPPAGTFALSTAKAWLGQKVTLTQKSISDDVSAADAISRTVDWGDGSAPQLLGPAQTAVSKVYAAPGSYQVSVTLTDATGKSAKATIPDATVSVSRPSGTFKVSKSAVWHGEKFTVSWSGVSPDTTKVTLDLGDGSRVTLPRRGNRIEVSYYHRKPAGPLVRPGKLTLVARFSNANGEAAPVAVGTVELKRDGWRPAVAVAKPGKADRASSWKYIRGTVSDKGAGVAGVRLLVIETRGKAVYCYTAAKTWKRVASAKQADKCATVAATIVRGTWSVQLKGVTKGVLDIRAVATDRSDLTSTTYRLRQKITR